MGGAIASGNTAAFGVAATGTGTLSYQWRKDGAPLADGTFVFGATTAVLTLTNPQVADAGAYSVVVTDAADAQSVTSAAATLAVTNEAPRILSQSDGAIQVMQPGNARLFVNLAGSTPFTLQWRRNGVALNGPFTGSNVSLVDLLGVTPERAGTYQFEATNAYGSIVADPISVTLRGYEPTETWSFVHPGPQGNQLNALAFSPGRAYAVGNGGTVLTSTDGGANWTDASASFPRTQHSLNSALHDPANNQFVIGGGFTQLFTVPAGGGAFTNRAPAPPANESYNGLARDPAGTGRLVAVGGDFTTRPTRALARVSTDGGATWTPSLPGPTNGALNAVAFGAARFVAVGPGGSGNNVLHSADGLAWSPATLNPAATQTFRRVAFANGQFVAIGDGGVIYTSTDGQNFTQRATGTTESLRGVALLSGSGATAQWAAVGLNRTILTSTDDAVTWTPSPATGGVLENFPSLALLDLQADGTNTFVIAPAGRLLRSPTPTGFTAASLADVGVSIQSNYTAPFNDVIWDGPTNQYLAVASQGNVHASPDGFAWSRVTDLSGAFDFMPGIARFNGQLLVAGFKRVATSSDGGATWTEQPEIANAAGSLWGLAASATRAVAVGNGGTIASSSNGVDWAVASSGTVSDFRAVTYGNNRFVAVGGHDSGGTSIVIRTSEDGQTWTARDPGTTGQLWGVDYADGVWIAAGSRNASGGDAFILRSFDQGVTWSRSELPGTSFTFRLRHSNGRWYAVGSPGSLAVSRDRGETWDYIPLPARPGVATLRGIAVKATAPANAVIVGNDSTILVSGGESSAPPAFIRQPAAAFAPSGSDVEFSVAALNALTATYQWRKNGNLIAGATQPSLRLTNLQPGDGGSNYDVVVTNPSGASATSAPAVLIVGPATSATLPDFAWRNPLPEGGSLFPIVHAFGKFIATGVGGRVVTSPDGAAWSPAGTIPTEQVNGLATDGTTVVAAGSSGRLFTTTDAAAWTPRGTQQQFNFTWFNSVAFADGRFVAVGDNGRIATSTDSGATWTVRTSGTTQRLTGVAGTTGRFVAVGSSGGIFTSTDAETWSPGTVPGSHTNANFQGAAFLNGQFILAAGNLALLTSADGLSWTARPTGFSDWIHRIGHTGTHYLATLSGGDAVLRSTDLTTWERVTFGAAQRGATSFFGVAAGGGATVIVGSGGELRSSTDHGATWTSRGAEGGVQELFEVQVLDDQFVVVGSHGTALVSDDGRAWRRLNTNTGYWLQAVTQAHGRFIAATGFGVMLSMVDGDHWEESAVGDNLANHGLVVAHGQVVAVADLGRVRVSTDGLNWTTTQLPGVTANLRSIAARGDLVVIVADGGRIFTSTDFTTWTERTSGTGWNLSRVRAIDGGFFAVGDARTVLFSTDGANWAPVPMPDDANFGWAHRDIAKLHDGYYVASSEGRLSKTADLRTWTPVGVLAHQTKLVSLASNGTEVVVAGEGGALLSSSHPAVPDAPAFVTGLPAQTPFANNATVRLGVFATGAGPLAYQWSKNGNLIDGATGPLLVLPGATAGTYSVTVTNALGQTATTTTQLVVAGLPTGSGPLFGVGDLPGGAIFSGIRDAIKVGSVIHAVGGSAANANSGFDPSDTAIAWSSTGGLTVLPNFDPLATGTNFITASAITPDAAFIASRARADSFGLRHAVRVDRANLTNLNLGNLGGFTRFSAANSISDDGAVLAGFALNSSNQLQAVRFTAAGPALTVIPFLSPGDITNIPAGGRGLSADGTVMVGASSATGAGFGVGAHAFRYVHGTGVAAIPELTGGTWSTALAVSTDGDLTLVEGDSIAAPNGEVYLHRASTGAVTPLGTPNSAWSPTNIAGMSGDGAVVVVQFFDPAPDSDASTSYFHNSHGWFQLAAALATLPGANLTGWELDSALGISRDGTVVFGSGRHHGNREGFVAEFPAGFLAAFNPAPVAPANGAIIGTWIADNPDAGPGNEVVLIFRADGTYFQMETADATEIAEGAADGFERGLYTWDSATGAFTLTTLQDTNGSNGVSGLNGRTDLTLGVVGDTATVVIPGEGSSVFNRVTATASPLAGGWFTTSPGSAGFDTVVAFLPNGRYLSANDGALNPDPTDRPGIEAGTFTWDPATGAFSATAATDANGTLGFSHPNGATALQLAANARTATFTEGGEATGLTRVIDPAAAVFAITAQPTSQAVTSGGAVTFSVAVADATGVTFQWRKNGVPLAGATSASLTLASTGLADAGSYDVVITGSTGTITSAAVTLTVEAAVAPVMQDQPVSRRVVAGGKVQFRAAASGTEPLAYQWRKDGNDLPGATESDLWLGPVTPGDAGAYTVRVSNTGGAVVSAAAGLTVLPADPVLWQQFTEWSDQQAPDRLFSDGAGNLYASWDVEYRSPDVAGGRLIGAVARFNEFTGVLDPTFQLDRRIRSAGPVVRLGNGQLLVSTSVGDASTVIRVSATGVVDGTFTAPRFARGIRFLTLQPDGKVLVAATDNLDANAPVGALAAAAPGLHRLNANGTVDAGFTPAVLNANGLLFAPPVVDGSGRIYLAGAFGTVNGTARSNVARLSAAGALDPVFAATPPAGFFSNQARGVGLQSDGRAVVVGDFTTTARGTSGDPIMAIRFNADGAFDSTYAQPLRSELGLDPAVGVRLRHLVMQSDDKLVAVSDRLVRLNADGSRDTTFTSHALSAEAFWVARAADGRYFVPDVGGVFGTNLEQPLWANGIAVFAADGTPDFAFQTGGFGWVNYPTSGRVLSDGTVLQAGVFNRFGTTPLPGIARFTAPGTLDSVQVPAPTGAPDNFLSLPNATIAAAADDRTFVIWNGATLRRLAADGTADATFNPMLPEGYSLGTAVPVAAPAGRLILAQGFVAAPVALAGGTGDALLRLHADGSRDTGFTPGLASFATVDRDGANNVTLIRTGGLNVAQILPDGRILIIVSAIDGNLRLQRLHADGSLDTGFNAPSFGTITPQAGFTDTLTDPVTNFTGQFPVQTFNAADLVRAAVQLPDGKVYVGGRFALAGAPRGLARLHADGTLDATFTGAGLATTATDAGPYVDALAVDSSGRLYVAGRFTSFNGTAVSGLFRLAATGTLDTAWAPGFGLRDVPEANASLVIANDRLHVFGTPGVAGEALPLPYRFVDIPPSNLPLILAQPASVAVPDGDLMVLSVSVFGAGPFTFQWARNGVPVDGATGASLTLDPVTAANAGSYTVAVTGPTGGTITSSAAVVSVTPAAPGFEAAGNLFGDFGDVVTAGTNAALHAVTTFGSEPITYQWRFNGADLPGATDPSLFLANWQPADAGLYSVRATNAQGTTTSPAEPFYVQPEGGWRWRNPLPTGNGITFVRFLNGQFFAGGVRGTLLTSTDGVAWTQRTVPATNNLLGLQLLNGRYVLLGSLNSAFTSPDGLAWTPRELPLNGALTALQDLMAGGGQVVAVGTGGLTARSPDGITWTVGAVGPAAGETLFGGGFFLNRFFAVGMATGRVYSSTDAVNWAFANTPATAGLLSLAQGAGRLVAVGVGGAIITSTDGLAWSTVASPATLDLNNVTFANNRFVATGDFGTIFTSPDGLTWTARAAAGNQSHLIDSAFGNGVHVAIGQAGNTGRVILTSPDAAAWTFRITGPRQGGGLLGLATDGTTLVAVGRDFTGNALALSSTDAATWTDRTPGTTQPLRDVAFAAGKFVAVGDAAVVTTSANGAAWSVATTSGLTGATLRGIRHDGAQWLAVGDGGGVFTSTDAVAWTARTVPTTSAVNQVAFGGGTYAAVTGAGEILTSSDPAATWTKRVAAGAAGPFALNAVAHGGGTFVAVGDGGVAYTSANGTDWTFNPFTTTSLVSVNHLNGHFIATSASHRTYVSTDGSAWTGRTTGAFDGLRDTVVFGNEVVGVGDFGTILTAGAPVVVGPASLMVNSGASAALRAAVSASPFPVTYVWSKGNTPLPGNNSPVLVIPAAGNGDVGAYTLAATNAFGTTTSATANLTLNVGVAITVQPQPQTVLAGGTASFSVTATGDPAPTYQWRLNGLNLPGANAATLTLTNVQLSGAGTVTVVVSNPGGAVTSDGAALTVHPLAPVITSAATALAVVNRPFGYRITTNQTVVATFSATGLPAGLSLNSATGIISGTPTATGSFTVALGAGNVTGTAALDLALTVALGAGNVTGTAALDLALTVAPPPPVITSPASTSGRVGVPFAYTITATNAPTGFLASGLPAGLTLDGGTGVISGTPTVAGAFAVALAAQNTTGANSVLLSLFVAPPLNAPAHSGPTQLNATAGAGFTFTPNFGAGVTGFALVNLPGDVPSVLPAGLGLDPLTGVISGTPTQVESRSVALQATSADGTATVVLTLTVNPAPSAPRFTSPSSAVGTVGASFNFALTTSPAATSFGSTPLPAGLALNATTGALTGTPTVPGVTTVGVTATNANGTALATLNLTINSSALAPVLTNFPVAVGRAGTALTFPLIATNAPEQFVVVAGTLPVGLGLNAATGLIAGTPTASGQARVWFAASNTAGGRGPAMEMLFDLGAPLNVPVITSNGTASGQVGQPFTYQIRATNTPTGFATTALPPGLSLNAGTGAITGVPQAETASPFFVALTAANADGTSLPKLVAISVVPAPATPRITSPASAGGRVGVAFSYQTAASENPTSFAAGTLLAPLPAGLALDPVSGLLSGTPTVAGTFVVPLRAGNAAGQGQAQDVTFAFAAALEAPRITSDSSATGRVGAAFTYQIVATGSPTSFAVSGELPLGLVLNTLTGVISGNPADDPDLYEVALTATNASGTSQPQTLLLAIFPADNVPVITSPVSAAGRVGQAFTYQITATNVGDNTPFPASTFLDAVGLPAGLAVNPSTGLIQGTPAATGTFTVLLVGVNENGFGLPRVLTLTVNPAPSAPVVNSPVATAAQVGQPFTYQITATNLPTSFEALDAPAWLSVDNATGLLAGTPTAPGPITLRLRAANAGGESALVSLTVAIAAAPDTPVITSGQSALGLVGAGFSFQLVATNTPTSFVATGLPTGLALDPVTDRITGTPQVSGTFAVTVGATNANGPGQPVTLTLTINPSAQIVGGL